MLRRELIDKIKKSIYDWANQYPNLELSLVEVFPSGIPDDFNVIVVAKKGFENWDRWDRTDDLYWFLHKHFADFKQIEVSKLWTFTG